MTGQFDLPPPVTQIGEKHRMILHHERVDLGDIVTVPGGTFGALIGVRALSLHRTLLNTEQSATSGSIRTWRESTRQHNSTRIRYERATSEGNG